MPQCPIAGDAQCFDRPKRQMLIRWLNSLVAMALDLQLEDRESDSLPAVELLETRNTCCIWQVLMRNTCLAIV